MAVQQQSHVAGGDQEGEIEGDAEAYQQPADRRALAAHQTQADQEIERRAGWEKEDIEQAEACAEEVVGEQDDGQAEEAGPRGRPIEEEDCRDECIVDPATSLHLHIVAKSAVEQFRGRGLQGGYTFRLPR